MKNEKVDFGPLLLLINIAYGLCVLFFCYLLFGDILAPIFKPDPIIVQQNNTGDGQSEDDFNKVVDGVHLQTGLIYAEGFELVRGTCTACHSAKIVTQNRATKEGWVQMIRWMQKTQGLWDLGENESIIVDYLAKHYAPEDIGRRANLDIAAIEWYILELDE